MFLKFSGNWTVWRDCISFFQSSNCLDSPSEMSIEFLQISKYKLDTFNRTLTTMQLQNSNELINGAYVIQTELSQLREQPW